MFLNKLTLIRDKVYQFQMYAYLQRLFKTRSGCNIEVTIVRLRSRLVMAWLLGFIWIGLSTGLRLIALS